MSLECRYQPISDPIAEACLLPVTGDWNDVYANWDRYQWYWRNRRPVISVHDNSWERWRDLAAIESAMRGDEIALPALEIAAEWASDAVIRATAANLLSQLKKV